MSPEIEKLTNGWIPHLPQAHEKSVVLGGARVLFPCHDPEKTAAVLAEYATDIARRAYQQGKRDGKAEIRKAIFE